MTTPSIRMAHPVFDERAKSAVLDVLDSGRLVQGEQINRLEAEFAAYIGVKEAIAVSSGTAALVLSVLAHGIGPSDEVITTPFSFVATANAVLSAGARPVFVDVLESDGCLDPGLVEAAITGKTRAILPVHLYGHPCDLTALVDIAQRHGIALIEDAAQAHGAAWNGKRVGGFGTGCFSLYATKNLTAGEGGIVTTNDADVARRVRLLRNHGQDGRYHHTMLGYNFRMTEVQAALALAGLPGLEAANNRRRENAAFYDARLMGVGKPIESPFAHHVYHQYTMRVPNGRDELARQLQAHGIESSVHYPVTIPNQPYYREIETWGPFPVADKLAAEVLSIPVHGMLERSDLEVVAAVVNEWSKPHAIATS